MDEVHTLLSMHSKNVLVNNLVTVVNLRDYPSHANSKNAVLIKYLMDAAEVYSGAVTPTTYTTTAFFQLPWEG